MVTGSDGGHDAALLTGKLTSTGGSAAAQSSHVRLAEESLRRRVPRGIKRAEVSSRCGCASIHSRTPSPHPDVCGAFVYWSSPHALPPPALRGFCQVVDVVSTRGRRRPRAPSQQEREEAAGAAEQSDAGLESGFVIINDAGCACCCCGQAGLDTIYCDRCNAADQLLGPV